MMAVSIHSIHDRLADEIIAILDLSAPKFDLAAVAERGKEHGAFNQKQADTVQFMGLFPPWLTRRLRARLNLPADQPKATTVRQQRLVEGLSLSTPAPTVASRTRLPDAFAMQTLTVDPVELRSGGASRHHVRNFVRALLRADGMHDGWSDPGADIYLPFLEKLTPHKLPGHAFLCVVEGATIYTHWLLDTLPRLLLLRRAGHCLDRYDSFFFTDTSAPFQQYTIDLIGIPAEKVFSRREIGPYVACDSFDHVSAPRTNFATDPSTYALVRDFFVGDGSAAKRTDRRIYISRAKARRRRVLNEVDMEVSLALRGFETLHLEDHNVSETARIMAEASHVVALHGAGLANLVFARPGTRVLEIFGAHLSAEYWRICGQCGLDYHALEARAPDGTPFDRAGLGNVPYMERNGMDFIVPLRDLEAYLDETFL